MAESARPLQRKGQIGFEIKLNGTTFHHFLKHSSQHSRFMHVIFRDRFGDRGAAKGRDEVVNQCNGW